MAEPDAADAGGADLMTLEAELVGDVLGAVGRMLAGVARMQIGLSLLCTSMPIWSMASLSRLRR